MGLQSNRQLGISAGNKSSSEIRAESQSRGIQRKKTEVHRDMTTQEVTPGRQDPGRKPEVKPMTLKLE